MHSEGTVVGSVCLCEGYSSLLATFLCVCLSVCYHASEGIARFYAKKEIRTALV